MRSHSPPCARLRSPLLKRPVVNTHRSGSAEERKQKSCSTTLQTALPRLVNPPEKTLKNPREDHFLLAMEKKLAHSEQHSAPENSGTDNS
jgi:hypothetical protein